MYSNSMHNNMMRRSNNTVRTVAIVVASGLFLYGLYAYHDLNTRHRRSEEKADRLRQQHDSLSAQLQVVYEQKSRLDKLLQQEKADHKQTKDDMLIEKKRSEQKYLAEKQELLNRIKSISSEHKMLQGQHDDLQNTFSKLQDQLLQLDSDCKKETEQHAQEFSQMKQENENELARLRDAVANLQRRNIELQSKLQAAIQQNQISQHQVDAEQQNIAKLQEQLAQLQGNLVANLAEERKGQSYNQQQQEQQQQQQQQGQQQQQLQLDQQNQQLQLDQQQPHFQQQQMLGQQDVHQEIQLQAQKQEVFAKDRQAPVQDEVLGPHLQQQQQQIVEQQPEQQPEKKAQQEQQPVMQVAQPGEQRRPYFDPKEAKPDHEVIVHNVVDQQEDDGNAGIVNQQQVLAPNINQLGADLQKEYLEKRDHNVKDGDFQRLNDAHADQNDWRNVHEPPKDEDERGVRIDDKHFDQGGFNRINQLNQQGAPLLGPNLGQDVEHIQGPVANVDGIVQEKPNWEPQHRPGQIVGPDINEDQADRIKAPVGQGQDELQGQMQNDDLNLGLAVNDDQDVRDDIQLRIPGGHVPVNNGVYQDNQDGNDDNNKNNNNENDNNDQDDDEDDQLDDYPN